MLAATTEESAAEISKRISSPRTNKDGEVKNVSALFVIVHDDDGIKACQNVECSCKKHANVGKIVFTVRENGNGKEIKQKNKH